jgi:hypothetical protein
MLVNETERYVWIDDPGYGSRYSAGGFGSEVYRIVIRYGPSWWDDVKLFYQPYECGPYDVSSTQLAYEWGTHLTVERNVPLERHAYFGAIGLYGRVNPDEYIEDEAIVEYEEGNCEHGYPYMKPEWFDGLPASVFMWPEEFGHSLVSVPFAIVAGVEALSQDYHFHFMFGWAIWAQLVTVFGEPGLGVAKLDAVQSIEKSWEGRMIQPCGFRLLNDSGDGDLLWAELTDRDTDEQIDYVEVGLAPGAIATMSVTAIMVGRTWNLRLAAGHFDEGDKELPVTDDYLDFTVQLGEPVSSLPRVAFQIGVGDPVEWADGFIKCGLEDSVDPQHGLFVPAVGVCRSFWKSCRLAFDSAISDLEVFSGDSMPNLGQGGDVYIGTHDDGDAGSEVYTPAVGVVGKFGYALDNPTRGHLSYRDQVEPKASLFGFTRGAPLRVDSNVYEGAGFSKQVVFQVIVGKEAARGSIDNRVIFVWNE